jgi:hypothetical protein
MDLENFHSKGFSAEDLEHLKKVSDLLEPL